MNFNRMTTDELLEALPTAKENGEWELKNGSFCEPSKREKALKELLGRQVSAFANSGGGALIIGLKDDTLEIDPVNEAPQGNRSFAEWLDDLLHTCVDYPVQKAEVHRIALSASSSKAIYAIAIPKSEAAPHRSAHDNHYYWRAGKKTLIAPHWYLDLLHNQATNATLSVENFECSIGIEQPGVLRVTLFFDITNSSHHIASPYGVILHIEPPVNRPKYGVWSAHDPSTNSADAAFVEAGMPHLFPRSSLRVHKDIYLTAMPEGRGYHELYFFLQDSRLVLRPVSQNYSGQPVAIAPLDFDDATFSVSMHESLLRHLE